MVVENTKDQVKNLLKKHPSALNLDAAFSAYMFFRYIKKCSSIHDFEIQERPEHCRIGFRVRFGNELFMATVIPYSVYDRWSPKEIRQLFEKLDIET